MVADSEVITKGAEAPISTPQAETEEQPITAPDSEQQPNKATDLEGVEESPTQNDDGPAAAGKAKKRKKKKKKGPAKYDIPALENGIFRRLGNWPAVPESTQSFPPDVPIHVAFPKGNYPEGEIGNYISDKNQFRATSAELKEREKLNATDYENLRRAAECHRQTRKFAQSYIRPGMKMIDLCQQLEAKSRELIAAEGLACGWGFPTGCSLNNVAAHYTPNYGDETVLQQGDIMKLDFGVHVAGRIIDSAFTVAFDPKFDTLIQATQEGTNTGLREAGIDARLGEIGAAIQETIESFEMEVNGKAIRIKPVANLNGHSIAPYQVHGGKSVPIVKTEGGAFMEEGEVYAIETFATTGRGHVIEDGECSHYMKDADAVRVPLARVQSSRVLLSAIDHHFGTLAFCRRWLDDIGQPRHRLSLKVLSERGIITPYPPLVDEKGSFVSQMEHTVLLRPTCKEILSRGPDF